ncbi:helix-turn-helix domain-containing protein [Microbispora maris]|uniref:helix-turn-helix domain-containing protein n=1 Tax=Microbispora maris TaxID=3144104 RepID=UPI003D154F32
MSNTEIAAELFVGEATVKTHVSRVMAELGARDGSRPWCRPTDAASGPAPPQARRVRVTRGARRTGSRHPSRSIPGRPTPGAARS